MVKRLQQFPKSTQMANVLKSARPVITAQTTTAVHITHHSIEAQIKLFATKCCSSWTSIRRWESAL